jgi:hypothetical protein
MCGVKPARRPELAAEVKYLTWTGDNLLRQVVYERLREDKPAAEVRREVPIAKPDGAVEHSVVIRDSGLCPAADLPLPLLLKPGYGTGNGQFRAYPKSPSMLRNLVSRTRMPTAAR